MNDFTIQEYFFSTQLANSHLDSFAFYVSLLFTQIQPQVEFKTAIGIAA
jgi:hypothetical protein